MCAAKRGAFEMYESQVHEELSQLVGDSGALHKFLEAALRLENHAFESALGPVSPSLVHLTEPGATYTAPPTAVSARNPAFCRHSVRASTPILWCLGRSRGSVVAPGCAEC